VLLSFLLPPSAFLLSCALTAAVSAQEYPTKPVRIVVPASPGGGIDISARLIAPRLTEHFGRQVVVENRGAGGPAAGADTVVRSAPDGYTLLMGVSSMTILPHLSARFPYDPQKDLAPISQVATAPLMLAVHPSLSVRSVKELIAFARARPGQLNYSAGSAGSNPHLAMELLSSIHGLRMVHVPYKGQGPAIADAIAGHVHMTMATIIGVLPHVRNGRLRALGVTTARRSPVASDIPSIAEAGVLGYEAVQWYGLLAPAAVPREVIAKVHAGTVRAVQDSQVKERFLADGAETVGSTPEEFAQLIRSELARWGKLVKSLGLRIN
jgi:tripartite-type tricarboxylate transporter receptor subunit TctC